jgi:hypothetical protein
MRSAVLTAAAVLIGTWAFAQPPAACAPVAPITLVSPTVLGDGTPGSVTAAQIQAALNTGGHIRFNVGATATTINVATELIVTRAAVLDGGGNVTLSGQGSSRVLRVRGALVAAQAYLFGLQNITIESGAAPNDDGAGMLAGVDGDWQAVDVRVVNVAFRNNTAIQTAQDGGGGAIYAVGVRDLVIAGSVFEGNRGSNGGALYTLGTRTVTILGSRFSDNTATGTGGNPGSGGNAGAIGVDGAQRTVTICRTRILDNHSNAYGTGFFSVGYDALSPTTFYRVAFERNVQTSASQFAAGAYVQGVPFTIRESSFLFNEANGYSGLFLGPGATGTIENSTFYGNVARQGLGAAMSVGTTAAVTISNSTIVGNTATAAFVGGIEVGMTNALTLRNVILAYNTGGNIWVPWNIRRQVAGSNVIEFPRFRPAPSNQEEEAAVATGLQWIDPLVLAPAWNGGTTRTAALASGSPARDAGTPTGAPTIDQRGMPRDGTPDIGAYELGSDLIFANGFDSGDLAGWSSASTDGGDLTAPSAAILGPTVPGMQAIVNDTNSLYVVDTSPNDEDRYRARFFFDPSGIDPGETQSHYRTRIFLAFEESPNRRLAAIVLRRQAGAYSLMGRVRLDDDSQADTAFVPITAGPHVVEIDWRRSTGPSASDGSFQMWIDDALVGSLSFLDNSASAVDFARLGALSVKAGASGTMHWDEFESRRTSYIGP